MMLYRTFHQSESRSEHQTSTELRPLSRRNAKDAIKVSKTLKYLNIYIYAYFAINLKYIVSIHTINNFKLIVLYSAIVFNLIMSFTMLHGIVVLSLIKVVKHTVLYICLFCLIFNIYCFKTVCTVVILLLAYWFGSWLIAL